MTSAGWHPDPQGRADRRYHDGTRWTEHVAQADGTTTTDPGGAEPAPTPRIGPPPPRAAAPAAPAVAPEPPAVADASAAAEPPVDAGQTQRLTPEDIAGARSVAMPPARPIEADSTMVMSADEVSAATALAAGGPPRDATATHHTARMGPEEIAAAAELAAARDRTTPPPPTAPERDPRSIIGALGTVIGLALGVVALLSLAWTSAPGPDPSWWDLRDAVDTTGADLGTIAMAFVLTGVPFALGVGAVVTLARAIGTRGARAAAAVVVVLAAAGLAVAGFAAIDVRAPSGGSPTVDLGAREGAPVTLPDGTPVTDPATGEPVTVAEDEAGADRLTDEEVAAATIAVGEDRLTDAAAAGAAILAGAALVLLVGLALRGMAGRIVTTLGLLVVVGWAAAAIVQLGSTDVEPGLGLYATAAAALVFAIATAIPGRRPRT